MPLTGSNACRKGSFILPSHLPVVRRPAVAKQQRNHSTWGRRVSEPSGHGCALRNIHASSALQDEQVPVRPGEVCQFRRQFSPNLHGVDCMLVLGGASETDARVAVEGDTVTVQYRCMNSKGEVN